MLPFIKCSIVQYQIWYKVRGNYYVYYISCITYSHCKVTVTEQTPLNLTDGTLNVIVNLCLLYY